MFNNLATIIITKTTAQTAKIKNKEIILVIKSKIFTISNIVSNQIL